MSSEATSTITHRQNSPMASADSSLLNLVLCTNTERLFEARSSLCLESARNICTGSCAIMSARDSLQVAHSNIFDVSTAVRSASRLIERFTRSNASRH